MLKFSQDLFRHLILQSSSFYDVSYHLHSAEVASQLAGLLLSSLECEELSQAECLRSASLADIMTAGLQVESRTDNWGWDVEGRQCQDSKCLGPPGCLLLTLPTVLHLSCPTILIS